MSTKSQNHLDQQKSVFVGIDPSGYSCGIGLIGGSSLLQCWSIKQTKQDNWPRQSLVMATRVLNMLATAIPSNSTDVFIACEIPMNWHTSKGEASRNSEDVQKLYATVGAIIQTLGAELMTWARPTGYYQVWGVTPITWKGNAGKDMMVRRATRLLEANGKTFNNYVTHDAAEGLMLARALQERIQTNFLMGQEPPKGWSLILDGGRPTGIGTTTVSSVIEDINPHAPNLRDPSCK